MPEGREIEFQCMKERPWATKIKLDGITLDNEKLTYEQCINTRIAVIILGAIMLAIPVAIEVTYLTEICKKFKKSEKKRLRKEMRAEKFCKTTTAD